MGKKKHTKCAKCEGDGQLQFFLFFKRNCPFCDGSGKVLQQNKISPMPIHTPNPAQPTLNMKRFPEPNLIIKSAKVTKNEKKKRENEAFFELNWHTNKASKALNQHNSITRRNRR